MKNERYPTDQRYKDLETIQLTFYMKETAKEHARRLNLIHWIANAEPNQVKELYNIIFIK